jgi:hypothetical protein
MVNMSRLSNEVAIVTGASKDVGGGIATALGAAGARVAYPPQVGRISGLVSFEPDVVSVHLEGTQLHLEPGQTVVPHGPDRDLTIVEARARR